MKRQITQVSRSAGADTPLPNAFGKKCRQHGLPGTPVEGLTGMTVDTPDSDQRQRSIPETTQRRLEGFCLNTPLTLSQAQPAEDAETPTLGGEPQPAAQQQQQQGRDEEPSSSERDRPRSGRAAGAEAAHPAALGQRPGRHRLANISNLPPSPLRATGVKGPARLAGSEAAAGAAEDGEPCSAERRMQELPQQQQQQQQHGLRQQRRRPPQVTFLSDLLSPAATLPAPPSARRGSLGAAARTPCPPSAGAGAHAPCPGSACPSEEDFVLHTSQSYSRASQPAISPSVAAGLSAPEPGDDEEEEEPGGEEEDEEGCPGRRRGGAGAPFTTPSQDSREPRPHSPSAVTFSNAASLDQLPQEEPEPERERAPAATARPAGGAAGPPADRPAAGGGGGGGSGCGHAALDRAAAAASCTPGDGLVLLLGAEELEETTTPELEQIGLSSQDPGGSQLSAGAGAAAAHRARGGAAGAAAGRAGANTGAGAGAPAGPCAGSGHGSAGGVVCEEVTAKQVLFPIFRPKSTRKCVILVRHGESMYNKLDATSSHWGDPQVFDAPLTPKGRQQAVAAREALRRQLERHGHLGATLWLSSPLSRALETMALAAPEVEHLAQGRAPPAAALLAGGGNGGGGLSVSDHRVVVLSTIAEQCATTGDVGLPASQLVARFPAFASQLADLPEQWWFHPCPPNQNCAVQRLFGRQESLDQMRRRVSEFSRWLRNRPEQVVVAFGHCTFWKHFANSRSRMRNCEVLQMWW